MNPDFTLVHIVLDYLNQIDGIDVDSEDAAVEALQNDQAQLSVGNIPTDSNGNPITQNDVCTQLTALWETVSGIAGHAVVPLAAAQ
jgi:hypothetical protein